MHYDGIEKRKNIRKMWHVMQHEYNKIRRMSIEIALVFARKADIDVLYDTSIEPMRQASSDVFVGKYLLIKSSGTTNTINVNRPEVDDFNNDRRVIFSKGSPYHCTYFHNHTTALSFGINDFLTFIALGKDVIEIFLDAGNYIYIMYKQVHWKGADWRKNDDHKNQMKQDINQHFVDFCNNNNNPKYKIELLRATIEETKGNRNLTAAGAELTAVANLLKTPTPHVMNTSHKMTVAIGNMESKATELYDLGTIDDATALQVITLLSNAKTFTNSAERHFNDANKMREKLESDFLSQKSVMRKFNYDIIAIPKLELTELR